MARRQHNQSISLFPFLAVLVCTMGSLILLLLVTTRQIRNEQQVERTQAAEAASALLLPAPEDASEVEALKQAAELENAQIADLEGRIAATTTAVSQFRQQIATLTEACHEGEKQLSALQESAEAAARQLSTLETAGQPADVVALMQEAAELQARQQQLQARIDATTQELQQKQQTLLSLNRETIQANALLQDQQSALLSLRQQVRQRQADAATTVGQKTLIEFSNPSGTSRTPIIIDVSDAGYEFLPTGVRITAKDMHGFPIRDNPLLSGILTLHQHRSADSVTSQPYVLLLVRPDGCLPFYAAQRILSEAGVHFGYELLEEDRQIAAGSVDEREVGVIRQALLESLNRREVLYSMLRQDADAAIAATEQNRPADRRLIVRSDGRVITADDAERRPLEGKYYAGGEAPPRPLQKPAKRSQPEGRSDDRRFVMGDSDGRPVGREWPARPATPDDSPFAQRAQQPSDSQDAFGAGPQGNENHYGSQSLSNGTFREQQAVRGGLRGPTGQGSGGPDTVQADEVFAQNAAADAGGLQPGEQPGSDSQTASSMASEAAPEALFGSSSGLSSTSASSQGFNSASVSGQPPSAMTASAFPDPMAESDGAPGKPVDLTRIDPELLKLLKARQSDQRELSTPVGITVFLDAQHMTIGQQPAVYVTRDTLDQALAVLLQGISAEVAASRREPLEPLLPIVKFVVSPGGEQLRIPLARELQQIGIPSASVVEVSPYVVPVDDTGRAIIQDTSETNTEPVIRPAADRTRSGDLPSVRPGLRSGLNRVRRDGKGVSP